MNHKPVTYPPKPNQLIDLWVKDWQGQWIRIHNVKYDPTERLPYSVKVNDDEFWQPVEEPK